MGHFDLLDRLVEDLQQFGFLHRCRRCGPLLVCERHPLPGEHYGAVFKLEALAEGLFAWASIHNPFVAAPTFLMAWEQYDGWAALREWLRTVEVRDG